MWSCATLAKRESPEVNITPEAGAALKNPRAATESLKRASEYRVEFIRIIYRDRERDGRFQKSPYENVEPKQKPISSQSFCTMCKCSGMSCLNTTMPQWLCDLTLWACSSTSS